ncbi:hypothetical protein EN829_039455 [Mesorhizobium sp. M00.F.Ca.ET.186.01.1.1]|nr:hypothetical protein EN829_039455 [Mesorhizobium sp. M00.F.Ca.ET.186.01.1.1]
MTISLPIRNLCMIAALTFTIFSPADFNILHAFFNFEETFTLFCSEIIVVVILVFYRLGQMIFRDLMNKKERGLPNA